jgi:3-oxoadipate enol-lactonase
MDALAIERAHWVGLSIGGMYGQSLLLRYPQRFHCAVLCDTTSDIPDAMQSVWEERIRLVRDKGLDAIVDATMQRWFTPDYIAANSPAFQAIRRQVLSTDPDGYISCCRAIQGLHYLERLSEIEHPVAVIVGAQDMGTPVSASEAIHQRIANSELAIIDNAAHISNVEQSDEFNKVLTRFLTAQTANESSR